MTIYWTRNSIPALRDLTAAERYAAVRPVVGKVYRHWQVWLPFLLQAAAFIVVMFVVPPFPNRIFIVMVLIVPTAIASTIPFNHYLQRYLDGSLGRL